MRKTTNRQLAQAVTAVVGVALLLLVTGCSAGSEGPPRSPSGTPSIAEQHVNIPVVSEANGCAGDVSVTVPPGWELTNGSLVNKASYATIKASCDNRTRYETAQPGLAWTLNSVEELVWSAVLHDPTATVQHVHLGQAEAIRLTHVSSGSWWVNEDAVIGDSYVGVEAEVPQRAVTSAVKKEIASILDTASANLQGTQP